MVVGGSSLELRFRQARETSGQLMACFIVLGLWWRKEMVMFHFLFLFCFLCCLLTLNVFFVVFVLFVCLTDKKFWFSGDPTKPEKYGYRKGSEEEARDGKRKQTMNRVVSVVAEGTLSGTVSKGLKNEFKLATDAAKGSAGKAEFLEKQLHLEKAAREK